MEIYLKRYFWTLPFIMIVACAILAALGVNHVVEAKFLADDGAARPHKPHVVKPVVVKPPPSKDPQDVIARNMFCSTCDPPLTSLPLALLATIVASDPSSSAATVFNTQSFRSGSYSVGDTIPDAGQV